MIIKFPTGLYETTISQEMISGGSITFLISNSDPPRTDLIYSKVPQGVIEIARPPKDPDIITRRKSSFGELIYSLSKASRSDEGDDSRQYELGQVLEFDVEAGKDVEPMLVSEITEIQHNTNRLDYDSMGLTSDEKDAIEDVSLATQNVLMNRLNDLKRSRANADQQILVNQKLINETTRTIKSLEITLSEAPDYGSLSTELSSIELLIDKLKAKRDKAFADRDYYINRAEFYSTESSSVIDKLRSVGVLVK